MGGRGGGGCKEVTGSPNPNQQLVSNGWVCGLAKPGSRWHRPCIQFSTFVTKRNETIFAFFFSREPFEKNCMKNSWSSWPSENVLMGSVGSFKLCHTSGSLLIAEVDNFMNLEFWMFMNFVWFGFFFLGQLIFSLEPPAGFDLWSSRFRRGCVFGCSNEGVQAKTIAILGGLQTHGRKKNLDLLRNSNLVWKNLRDSSFRNFCSFLF